MVHLFQRLQKHVPQRPLLVVMMAFGVWGTLKSYEWFHSSLPVQQRVEQIRNTAEGEYSVVTTLTFDASGDEFDPLAMRITLEGRVLFESFENQKAGVPVVVSPVPGLKTGINELLVEVGSGTASVESVGDDPFADSGFGESSVPAVKAPTLPVARAIRIQVLLGDQVVADQTLWSEPGEPVVGLIILDIPRNLSLPAGSPAHDQGHDH